MASAPPLVTTLALAQSVPDAARAAVVAAATAPDAGADARSSSSSLLGPLAGALVYLDAGAAEVAALSWGGAPFLTGLGAAAVCDLDSASPDDALLPAMAAATVPPPPHTQQHQQPQPSFPVVFFITSLLTDSHGAMVRALALAAPRATRATVLCAVTEEAHACCAATPLGVGAYEDYGRALAADAEAARAAAALAAPGGNGGGGPPPTPLKRVAVRHVPMAMAALDGGAFVLPAAGAAATLAATAGAWPGRAAGYGPVGKGTRRRRRRAGGDDDADRDKGDGGDDDGTNANEEEGSDGSGSSSDDESDDDDDDDPAKQAREGGLRVLAHALAGAGAQLGLRFDAFALGPASRRVARCVQRVCEEDGGGGLGGLAAAASASSSSSRAGPALRVVSSDGGGGSGNGPPPASTLTPGPARAALILVDRSLDLATPVLHSDHPLDAMAEMLPRRPPILTATGAAAGAPPPPPHHAAFVPRAAWRPADMRVDVPGFAALDPLADLVASEAKREEEEEAEAARGGGKENKAAGGDDGAPAAAAAKPSSAARPAPPPPPPPPGALPPLGLALAHPSDLRALSQLEQLRLRRGGAKECGGLLRRWLKEAGRAERAAPPTARFKLTASGPSAEELSALAMALASDPGGAGVRQQGLVALALGSAAALGAGRRADRWRAAGAMERQVAALLAAAAEEEENERHVGFAGGGGGGGVGGNNAAAEALLPMLLDALARATAAAVSAAATAASTSGSAPASSDAPQSPLALQDVLALVVACYALSADLARQRREAGAGTRGAGRSAAVARPPLAFPGSGGSSLSTAYEEGELALADALAGALRRSPPAEVADALPDVAGMLAAAAAASTAAAAAAPSAAATGPPQPAAATAALARLLEARVSAALRRLRWAAARRAALGDARRVLAPPPLGGGFGDGGDDGGGGGDDGDAGAGGGGAPRPVPLLEELLAKVLLRGDFRDLAPGGRRRRRGAGALAGAVGEVARAGAAQLSRLLQTGLGRLGGGGGGGGGPAATTTFAPAPDHPDDPQAASSSSSSGQFLHPSDYDAVVIFVVGGVCSAEVRAVRRELARHAFGRRPALVVGGTALVGPADVVRHVFAP